ncbi:uncharacterized protein ACRADG_001946 [Cochliomyia hominivorax]
MFQNIMIVRVVIQTNNTEMEQIEYTRTVVPSSMRSPYWKYFGFPSDSSNNILTRQKIVCTICNTAIAYNKNTSNLRTHLMSKHVEIFQKIIKSSNSSMGTNKCIFENKTVDKHLECDQELGLSTEPINVCNINMTDTKKPRSDSNNDVSDLQSRNNFLGDYLTIKDYNTNSQNNSSTYLENKVDLELGNPNYIGLIAANDSQIVGVSETSDEEYVNNLEVVGNKHERSFAYAEVEFPELHEPQQQSIDIMLADMIQTDLLSLQILQNNGFCKYNQQLTGFKVDDDTIKRVKDVIEKRYTNIKGMITSHVDRLSQRSPYSLSFEVYKDYDEQTILNIYYNYLNDDQTALVSFLYESTPICTKTTNISEILVGMNLENCSAVVIPSRESDAYDFIANFTNYYELPLIECLESMLTCCLEKIFGGKEFSEDFSQLYAILQKYHINIETAIPRRNCYWSKLNFLDHIFKRTTEEQIDKWNEMKQIFEYIKPLKMAMDVISDEHLPLCTLIRPLIIKLFEEHFSFVNEEKFIRIFNIHKILEKELYERVIATHFLNEATFFDMRFHRDFVLEKSGFEISNLKSVVLKRFRNVFELSCMNKNQNIKAEQSTSDSFENIRKCSSLKSFFKRDATEIANNKVNSFSKTNFDLEFELYQNEACLDLDKSPALWWKQQCDNYKQLSKIAKFYLTIPCCCLPRLCRLNVEQRYLKLDQRRNLSQFCSAESKLWYLYYNDDIYELT